MKSLNQYKKLLSERKKELKVASFDAECAEHDFYENPCKETWENLVDARKSLTLATDGVSAVNEVIDHYDFYEMCWEEEMEEANASKIAFA